MSPYVRTMKTGSDATGVYILHWSRHIEHIDSAHDDVELEVMKTAARQRMAAGQGELPLGLDRAEPPGGVLATGRCRWAAGPGRQP